MSRWKTAQPGRGGGPPLAWGCQTRSLAPFHPRSRGNTAVSTAGPSSGLGSPGACLLCAANPVLILQSKAGLGPLSCWAEDFGGAPPVPGVAGLSSQSGAVLTSEPSPGPWDGLLPRRTRTLPSSAIWEPAHPRVSGTGVWKPSTSGTGCGTPGKSCDLSALQILCVCKVAMRPLTGIKRDCVKTLTCQVGQEDACDDHQLHTGAKQPPHLRVGDFGDVDLSASKTRAAGLVGP